MNSKQIENLVIKYMDMGNEMFGMFVPYPKVEYFQKLTAKAGMAYGRENKLVFNLQLAERNPDTYEKTICHEVSHLFTNRLYPNAKQHHGREFKTVMSKFGFTPNTYHTYDVTGLKTRKLISRYIVKCNCMEHAVSLRKFNNIHTYRCKKCDSRLTWTGKKEQYKGGARVK